MFENISIRLQGDDLIIPIMWGVFILYLAFYFGMRYQKKKRLKHDRFCHRYLYRPRLTTEERNDAITASREYFNDLYVYKSFKEFQKSVYVEWCDRLSLLHEVADDPNSSAGKRAWMAREYLKWDLIHAELYRMKETRKKNTPWPPPVPSQE